jgi:outer membrane protein assembly factor BamB
MRPSRLLTAASVSALSVVPLLAAAAPTRTFRQATAKDFEEGEATGSLILPTGEVVPGMKTSPIAVDAAFVWCATKSADGKTAYFGTGDEGKIFAVEVDGKETRAKKVATIEAAWVTALLARPDGTLLAASTPGGKIFSVDPKKGTTKLFATLPADHVWTLAEGKGVVYAGTGGPGKLFSIETAGAGAGKPKALWDSGDKHIVSLLVDDERHLLAGTSEEAILFRVSTDGKAEALADFDAEEVRAIAKQGGALYVAVNDFDRAAGAATPATTAAPKGTKVAVASAGSPSSAGALPRPGQRKSKAAVYKLDADGRTEQIFSIGDGYFTALAFDGEGRAFVGTGSEGRVYRIATDRTAALAIDIPERQALALVRTANGFLVGSGDVGGVYRAEPAAAKQATYLSRVLDADVRARWGLLRWHGAHALALESRSGNTAKPDATWSGFAALERAHATSDGGVGQVASPSARYVQYRVTFPAADARLGSVTLAYLPQNQRARITELTAGDSGSTPAPAGGLGGLGSLSTAAAPARAHSSTIKLRWKVENPDGDELGYRLTFREENEAVWRPLGGPDPLTKTDFDWNTEGLPDGTYVVRLTASDDRAQPRERALDTSFTSAPILVDNRKPEVLGLVARYPIVSGRAKDDQSPLTSLELAIDGGDWQQLSPADGIADDLVEGFSLKLPPLAPGPHAVMVRAWDSADNVGAAAVPVTVKGGK